MKRKSIMLIAALAIATLAFLPSEGQIFKTTLKITVFNELGNIEEGAKVELYYSDKDYKAEENQVMDAKYTDAKGRVTFKGLKPKVYYVNVVKDDKNNYGAGVKTDRLIEGKLNKVNIVIE